MVGASSEVVGTHATPAAEQFGGTYSGRRVFVTGHTGFKGSWLARWLIMLGANVTGYALDPPTDPSLFDELGLASRLTHVVGDVRDLAHLRDAMHAAEPEIVFHLAAQPLVRLSYDEPVSTYETNVMGTVNLLEAVRACPSVRAVVNVTSDKCYENRETGQLYAEDDAMGGYDPYSSSKGCAELVTAAYRRSFFGESSAVRVSSARAGNVVGGGDWAADRIVPDCIRALSTGDSILVRNPDAVRPWQHVLEPLSGYLHLASLMWQDDHELDGPWNFGPEPAGAVTVREVVDGVVAAWGSGGWHTPADLPKQPHEAKLLALDITKAKAGLGWRPVWDVARTIEITTRWYRGRAEDDTRVETLTTGDIERYVGDAAAAGVPWASKAG